MNIIDDDFATYKLLATEFEKRGYTVTAERDEDTEKLFVTYTSPLGNSWETKASRLGYPFTSYESKELSIHKDEASAYAKSRGISIPATYFINEGQDIDEAIVNDMLQKYGKLIVKPENSSLSRGLSLNVTDLDGIRLGVALARQTMPGVVIQEQVYGEEIRFIVMGGKIKAALLRRTPRVVGDGHSTVADLIVAENKERKTLVFPYISYPQLTDAIIDSHFFTDQTVLGEGDILEFNHATMIKNGCSVYNVLDRVHPSYIEKIEYLVKDIDTKFMASDLFLQDFTQPQQEDNYWFIEFNSSPVLKLCYGCRDGKMFDVIPLLVDLLDEHINRDKTVA